MNPIRLEHFITWTAADTIEAQLDRYRQAGFLSQEHTVRHDPGLRNGFVSFGPEYIEFFWVEDEDVFAGGGSAIPGLERFRPAVRPWGIGIEAPDVEAAHQEWVSRGFELPPVFSQGRKDAGPDAGPGWSFQPIPLELLPGVLCFALTYHGAPRDGHRSVQIAPNTTYAIDGITLVAADPVTRASKWQAMLAPDGSVTGEEGAAEVRIGPHTVTWLTPDDYQSRHGLVWEKAPHDQGEMALLHLLAESLDTVESMLTEAGRTVEQRPGGELFVDPDPQEGFTFVVTEMPAEEWANARGSLTGESFSIAR